MKNRILVERWSEKAGSKKDPVSDIAAAIMLITELSNGATILERPSFHRDAHGSVRSVTIKKMVDGEEVLIWFGGIPITSMHRINVMLDCWEEAMKHVERSDCDRISRMFCAVDKAYAAANLFAVTTPFDARGEWLKIALMIAWDIEDRNEIERGLELGLESLGLALDLYIEKDNRLQFGDILAELDLAHAA